MRNSKKHTQQEFDDLSRQIDDLLEDSGEKIMTQDDGIDLAQFTPEGANTDDGMVYQNFSNGYGADVRNYSNNYGEPGASQPQPAHKQKPAINAYNQDIQRQQQSRNEYRDYGGKPPKTRAARKVKAQRSRSRRGGCCGCGCATLAIVLAALAAGLMMLLGSLFEMPQSHQSLGPRKEDTAAILLCGTDKDGTRTDTMMLVYLDGAQNQVGLLSLPRDTLTITDAGNRAKLNSAYGRNGCGEEGMDWVLTYVERTIGYRPDGYILVDMTLVPKIVDAMGGVDIHLDHHIRVHTDGEEVYVPAGDQHLNGEEVLATLRYRAGYYNADLGRVQVQRQVIKACMEQWVSPANLVKLPQVLQMIQNDSLTDLSINNFLWIGKTILKGIGNLSSDTLPGYPDMRDGVSYYILYRDQVADLVNQSYNPYTVDVDPDDLDIAK